ncbi:MAG TPA: hypothetical protein VJ654_17270 [Noviherbaspirillum sp.]|nr:hypothetical protein [Noviherbaspirillum sp.]
MFNPSIIFHRTHEGREEIKQKSHGLTQSERLVLIMVDGTSSCQEIRAKLPALTDERFNRALDKLQKKELILEVFMPVEGQEAEELDSAVIDRFLQQDPLDPVTIIMLDPDEELAGIPAPAVTPPSIVSAVPQSAAPSATPAATSLPEVAGAITAQPSSTEPPLLSLDAAMTMGAPVAAPVAVPVVAMDEEHSEMADSLAQEVRQRQIGRPPRIEAVEPLIYVTPKVVPAKSSLVNLHWGYWLMGLGGLFIASYFLP